MRFFRLLLLVVSLCSYAVAFSWKKNVTEKSRLKCSVELSMLATKEFFERLTSCIKDGILTNADAENMALVMHYESAKRYFKRDLAPQEELLHWKNYRIPDWACKSGHVFILELMQRKFAMWQKLDLFKDQMLKFFRSDGYFIGFKIVENGHVDILDFFLRLHGKREIQRFFEYKDFEVGQGAFFHSQIPVLAYFEKLFGRTKMKKCLMTNSFEAIGNSPSMNLDYVAHCFGRHNIVHIMNANNCSVPVNAAIGGLAHDLKKLRLYLNETQLKDLFKAHDFIIGFAAASTGQRQVLELISTYLNFQEMKEFYHSVTDGGNHEIHKSSKRFFVRYFRMKHPDLLRALLDYSLMSICLNPKD